MSKAPAAMVDQAGRLVYSTRSLPADEAARVLERFPTAAQAPKPRYWPTRSDTALGYAYGGGSQFFAIWVIRTDRSTG